MSHFFLSDFSGRIENRTAEIPLAISFVVFWKNVGYHKIPVPVMGINNAEI